MSFINYYLNLTPCKILKIKKLPQHQESQTPLFTVSFNKHSLHFYLPLPRNHRLASCEWQAWHDLGEREVWVPFSKGVPSLSCG